MLVCECIKHFDKFMHSMLTYAHAYMQADKARAHTPTCMCANVPVRAYESVCVCVIARVFAYFKNSVHVSVCVPVYANY